MNLLVDLLLLAISIVIAYFAGKLVSKAKLPAILGWLITGIVIGPHALNILRTSIMDSTWFGMTEHIFECTFGLMIGTEMIWADMKKAGSQIVVTTITESLGTFIVVSLVFGIIFAFADIPIYLAFMFGGIALATAPAPSLSVVTSLKADGPVTRTLIPMAALDDLVGALVFFTVIALVSAHISSAGIPVAGVLFLVFLPVIIGIITGFITGKLLQHTKKASTALAVMLAMLLLSAGIGFAMIVVILDLAAPLDYHLIFGAGIYTAVYIIARAIGKYSGAWFGATVTHMPDTVRKYLGFTLLPHSGVSLVFTGIAAGVLEGPAPELAQIIQGTIAAAAVINEIIAVFMAKKGFEWAGELGKAKAA